MGSPTDPHELVAQLAERESAIANARAELRAEREQVKADRAEADRLLAEAQAAHEEATRARSRARRLAGRFASKLEQRLSERQQQLDERAAELAAEQERFAADVERLNAFRSEFHATAASARDRLADAWVALESQQKRNLSEWTEATRYFTEQNAVLDARVAELTQREKDAVDRLARAEADTAGLQAEAAAIEQRLQNAQASLAELEWRRDQIRTELLAAELPDDLIQTPNPDDLSFRERVLDRERAAVAALRTSLERESADVDDRRRLIAEQLQQLAIAKAHWQRAERQTVLEMEELARALRHKERELDGREQRLIKAESRRRSDAYDLWQTRLRLEAWQSKLSAFEMRWETEREQLEAHLERRIATLARREAAHAATFARWEQARTSDHTRLREELKFWAADRERLARASADFDRLRQGVIGELTRHAAEALAAEQMVAEAIHDAGSNRVVRRLRVLRRRWERVFARHARALIAYRAEVAEERATLDSRYHELHERLIKVGQREAEANSRQAIAEQAVLRDALVPLPPATIDAPSAELLALRGEVERLAAVVLDMELPEAEPEIPWAIEEDELPEEVYSFETTRAA